GFPDAIELGEGAGGIVEVGGSAAGLQPAGEKDARDAAIEAGRVGVAAVAEKDAGEFVGGELSEVGGVAGEGAIVAHYASAAIAADKEAGAVADRFAAAQPAAAFQEREKARAADLAGEQVLIPETQVFKGGVEASVAIGERRRAGLAVGAGLRDVSCGAGCGSRGGALEAGVRHAERTKEVFTREIGQRDAGRALNDEARKEVVGVRVFVIGAWGEVDAALLGEQAQIRGGIEDLAQTSGDFEERVRVAQAGGVMQEIGYRDGVCIGGKLGDESA